MGSKGIQILDLRQGGGFSIVSKHTFPSKLLTYSRTSIYRSIPPLVCPRGPCSPHDFVATCYYFVHFYHLGFQDLSLKCLTSTKSSQYHLITSNYYLSHIVLFSKCSFSTCCPKISKLHQASQNWNQRHFLKLNYYFLNQSQSLVYFCLILRAPTHSSSL